ncbi:unnamed protein product [Hapterophycus canaliculatus]
MRVGLATARALGFATRRARRGRGPCTSEPHRAPSGGGHQTGSRTTTSAAAPQQGRLFEDFVMSRSQLGATAVLATQIRAVVACSTGGFDASLEAEGDTGDDDDGT